MTPAELLALADAATPGPWPNFKWARIGLSDDADRLVALAPDLARLCAEMGEAMGDILEYDPPEVAKDDFAYDRLKAAYRDCARTVLAKLSELEYR